MPHAFHQALADPESTLHKSIAWNKGVVIIGSHVHLKAANTATNLQAFAETVGTHFRKKAEIEVQSHAPTSRLFKLPSNVVVNVRIKPRKPGSTLGDLVLEFDNRRQATRFVTGLAEKLAEVEKELVLRKAFARTRRGVEERFLPTGLNHGRPQ